MVNSLIGTDVTYSAVTDSLRFKIEESGGTVVYEGVAEPFPGESAVTLYINRLVADFIGCGWAPQTGVTTDGKMCKVFYLKNGSGTTLETYRFFNGYGDFSEGVASVPVNGHLDPRMLMPVSTHASSATTITIECDD